MAVTDPGVDFFLAAFLCGPIIFLIVLGRLVLKRRAADRSNL